MRFPEMVKSNARYRGPMESQKQTNSVLDIQMTIQKVREELEARKNAREALFTTAHSLYDDTIPTGMKVVVNGCLSLRGGEL